jgi:hypothetical protein
MVLLCFQQQTLRFDLSHDLYPQILHRSDLAGFSGALRR